MEPFFQVLFPSFEILHMMIIFRLNDFNDWYFPTKWKKWLALTCQSSSLLDLGKSVQLGHAHQKSTRQAMVFNQDSLWRADRPTFWEGVEPNFLDWSLLFMESFHLDLVPVPNYKCISVCVRMYARGGSYIFCSIFKQKWRTRHRIDGGRKGGEEDEEGRREWR